MGNSTITDLRRITLLQKFERYTFLDREISLVEQRDGALGIYNIVTNKWYDLVEINSSTEYNYQALDTTVCDWLSVGNPRPTKTITITFEEFALVGLEEKLSPMTRINTEEFTQSYINVVRGDSEFSASCKISSFTANSITVICDGAFKSPIYKANTVNRKKDNSTEAINNGTEVKFPTSLMFDSGLMYVSPYEVRAMQMKISRGKLLANTLTSVATQKVFGLLPKNDFGLIDITAGTYADFFLPCINGLGNSARFIHPNQRMKKSTNKYPVATNNTTSKTISVSHDGSSVTGVKKFITSNLYDYDNNNWYTWTETTQTTLPYTYTPDSYVRCGFLQVTSTKDDSFTPVNYFTNFFQIFPSDFTKCPTWTGSSAYDELTYDGHSQLNATPDANSYNGSIAGYVWQKLDLATVPINNANGKTTSSWTWTQVSTSATLTPSSIVGWGSGRFLLRCFVKIKIGTKTFRVLAFNSPWIGVGMNEIKHHFVCHEPVIRNYNYSTRISTGSTDSECYARKIMYSAIGTKAEEGTSGSGNQNKIMDSYGISSLATSFYEMQQSEYTRPLMLYPRNDYQETANQFMSNPLGFAKAFRIQSTGSFYMYPQLNSLPTDGFRYLNSGNFTLVDFNQPATLTSFLMCPFNLFNSRVLNIHEEMQVGITQENYEEVPYAQSTYGLYSDVKSNYTFNKFIPTEECCKSENIQLLMWDVL